jgi:hypothetical protein
MRVIASMRVRWETDEVIERVVENFREVAKSDRQGMARPTREKRASGVEQLRRILFDEDPIQSQPDRILAAKEHANDQA